MNSVGKSYIKKDAITKVRGIEKYIEDYFFDNMVYAKIIRSPVARMLIKKIDYSKAEKIEGFSGYADYRDVPVNKVALVFEDWPCFPEKYANYYGEGIAIIAAENYEIAERCAKEVKIIYEELEPLLDPRKSVESKIKIFNKDNIFKSFNIEKGDVEKAFQEADLIVEGEFETHHQEHSYIETQGCIALPQPDNSITIYASAQCPFYVQKSVALCLNIPLNKVRIIQTAIGGAFGGKEDVPSVVCCQAAVLAMKIKRPVKLIYKREEDIISMSKRHPSITRIKYAVKKDGKIIGCEVDFLLNGGAYSSLSPIVLWRGTVHAAGPYNIPNVKIVSKAVATNTVPCGAYRGFGQPQSCFSAESLIDEIAQKLNITPYEIRKINGLKVGDTTATSHYLDHSVGYLDTLDAVVNKTNYLTKLKEYKEINKQSKRIKKCIGLSSMYYGVGLGAGGRYLARAGAYIQVTPDASVILAVGNTDMGQGAKTVLAQIAAEALGCNYDDINILDVDTALVPDSGPTVASRTTVMSGNAIIEAAKSIRKNIDAVAMDLLNISNANDLINKDGYFLNKNNESKKVSFKEVVKECWNRRLHLTSQGWYVSPECTFSADKGQGDAYFIYSYASYIVDFDLDIETGIMKFNEITCAVDFGKAINPQLCEGQIQGGNIQGLGWAVYEELKYKDGKILNPNFTDYIIPGTMDIPEKMNVILIEKEYNKGPYGAKGLGECPLIGIAPAIRNALFNCVNIKINKLPLTPEKVLKEIKEKKNEEEKNE
ncbi:MAG TPA: xanthine dehydrogenase family protein molybdopterin-binding subunit [bacterium]|nr:xanthine dehydrogenase family protein molybdopterin-binding subunit [bacterium]HOL48427.1 xanthine dehydrogenase family protein molybdopterin-binding subunit [bacterium]HPQ20041.1 xanthine dehydrogenase family protein molybdopterin-binding subunit [bacterium]